MGVTMSVEENSNLSIKNWLAILVLAISTFIIVTTELAPVGLLTPMAKDFGVSESQIGVTVTIYAWVGAFSAILASVFLGNIAKKTLLIVLITILLASNTLSATVTTYSMLLVARVIGALAHGSFWAIIGATAVAIVPPKHIGVATSIVFGGVSAASVFGVPLSNYIDEFYPSLSRSESEKSFTNNHFYLSGSVGISSVRYFCRLSNLGIEVGR